MAIKKELEIDVKVKGTDSIKNLNKEIDNTKVAVESSKGSLSGMIGVLDKFTGGAVSKIKGFTTGLKGMALGFKGVGVAIAASGIGLVVLAIAAIGAAFKGSEAGQNKFAKLMGVLGTIIGNVVDVLADLGDFIIDLFSGDGAAMTKLKSFGEAIFNVIGLPIKNVIDTVKALGKALGALFSGDISGAFDELKQGVADVKGNFDEAKESIQGATGALKEFVNQNIEEAKAAAKVADQRAKADLIERDLIVERAKAEREIADLRLKARDLNHVSAKERQEALNKVLELQDGLAKKEVELLSLRRDAQIAENGFARSNKENLDAAENAKAAVIAAETKRTDQQRAIQRELTQAENELNAEAKARAKERQDRLDADAKAEMERLKGISDFKNELIKKDADNDAKTEEQKLALERTRAEAELQNLVGSETEKREAKIALDEYYNQLEDELRQQRADEQLAMDAKIADIRFKAEQDRLLAEAKLKVDEAGTPLDKLDAQKELLELQNAQLEEDYATKQELYKEDKIKLAQIDEDYKSQKTNINSQLTDNTKKTTDEEVKLNQAVSDAKVQIADRTLGLIAAVAGEGSKVGKALAVGQATISGIEGVQNSFTTASKSPITTVFPAYPFVQAGLAGSFSALQIQKILSTDPSGKGGKANPSTGGGGVSAPSFNLVAGSGTNQIAEGISQQPTPLRAFVVSSEVTTAQSLDRNIEDNASF